MAREAFSNLAALVARIDRSMSALLRLGTGVSRESGRLGLGNQLRVQIQSALGSPAIIHGLQNVLNRGMGGQATRTIQNAVGNYQAAMRQHQTAVGQQNALMQRMGNIQFRQQQVINANPVLSGIQAAAQAQAAGMAPHQARAVMQRMVQHLAAMSPQFALYQRQLGQTIQAWTMATSAAQQAMGRAGVVAQAGRAAAMGPGGIPHGGGVTALANVIQRFGGTGMGSLVGTLFGPMGTVIGAAFDLSLKAVTKAFDMLQKSTRRANETIDRLAMFSIGGFNSAITRAISEVRRDIYVSRELGKNMMEFASAQARSVDAWKDVDVAMEKFNLQVATAWEEMKAFVGENVAGPLARQVKEDPMGSLGKLIRVLPFVGQMALAVDFLSGIYKLMLGEKEDKKDLLSKEDKLSPWEKKFVEAERMFRGIIQRGAAGRDPLGERFQDRLKQGIGAPGVGPPNPAGLPMPGGPGGPAGGPAWVPPAPPPAAPPPVGPPGAARQPAAPLPDPVPLLNRIAGILDLILRNMNPIIPGGAGPLGP